MSAPGRGSVLREGWWLAAGTLTALPVRVPRVVDRDTARAAMLLAPLVVLPLCLGVALVAVLGGVLGLPPLVTALLAVGVLALGSRAMHLDGLSDTVDGLTASHDRARSLQVMKSGTAGPAGVVALVVVIGLQSAALGTVLARADGGGAAVLAGLAVLVSRAALTLCCSRGVPSARPDGLGDLYTGTVPRLAAALVWLLAGLALAGAADWAGLPWWQGPLAAAVALAVLAVLLRHTVRRLGGVTGDVFGAAVELCLTALLVALAAWPA